MTATDGIRLYCTTVDARGIHREEGPYPFASVGAAFAWLAEQTVPVLRASLYDGTTLIAKADESGPIDIQETA